MAAARAAVGLAELRSHGCTCPGAVGPSAPRAALLWSHTNTCASHTGSPRPRRRETVQEGDGALPMAPLGTRVLFFSLHRSLNPRLCGCPKIEATPATPSLPWSGAGDPHPPPASHARKRSLPQEPRGQEPQDSHGCGGPPRAEEGRGGGPGEGPRHPCPLPLRSHSTLPTIPNPALASGKPVRAALLFPPDGPYCPEALGTAPALSRGNTLTLCSASHPTPPPALLAPRAPAPEEGRHCGWAGPRRQLQNEIRLHNS